MSLETVAIGWSFVVSFSRPVYTGKLRMMELSIFFKFVTSTTGLGGVLATFFQYSSTASAINTQHHFLYFRDSLKSSAIHFPSWSK